MTHLPECLMNLEYAVRVCICTELRACEQRMLDDDVPAAAYHGEKGYTMGYLAALDAAEAAVSTYADKTHQHKGDLFNMCMTSDGDRCDITAALKQPAAVFSSLKEKP